MSQRLKSIAEQVVLLACVSFILAFPCARVPAQETHHSTPPTEPASTSPADFELQVAASCRQIEGSGVDPEPLVDQLVQRMKEFRVTTAQTVLETVHAAKVYEAKHQNAPRGMVRAYPNARHLIDTLLPLASDYPEAEAGLLADKAALLEQEGDLKGALPVFQRAVTILTPLGLSADVSKIRALNSRAEICARLGDAESARADFDAVLSYDWYKVTDPESNQVLYDQYIQAGRGLIELNRHNLKALNEIFFVPSALHELKPELDSAKEQAKLEAAQPK